MSYRGAEWNDFSVLVRNHVENYTIPQYGDGPNDLVGSMSSEQIELQIKKYIQRFGNNARGFEEAQRDLLKIAHYCGILYYRRSSENPSESAIKKERD